MEQLLQVRQTIINFYKLYEKPLNFYIRFFVGLFIFIKLGYLTQGNLGFSKVLIIGVCCGLLTAVIPITVFYVLLMIAGGFYMSFASIELAIIVMLIIFLIIVFYSRLFPVHSLLIPFMIIAYHLHIPYAIPIFAGIYVGVAGIVPITIGAFLWGLIPHLSNFVKLAPKSEFTPLGLPDAFVKIYVMLSDILTNNTQWISETAIFAAALLITYVIANLSINFSKEISIIIGGIIIFIGFTIGIILKFVDGNVLVMFLGVIISILVVGIIKFFESVLDYPNCERVQFEDDNNYYYVKVVPKLIVSGVYVKEKKHKRNGSHSQEIKSRSIVKENNDIEDE